jgi:hypothetical protein
MPGRNCEFDSSVADESATAGYQDGMCLGGHIGNILFRLRHSKEKRVTSAAGIAKMRSCRTLGRPLSVFSWC